VVRSVAWLGIFFGFAPHPSPLPLERELICVGFEIVYDSVFQVGAALASTPVSPLSLRERVRVRGFCFSV
jgi:hypothetical protein